MINIFEDRRMISQIAAFGLLAVILCGLLVHRFTTRSPLEKERARARVVLQCIHRLELAYFEQYGTYLPISRENNGDILKLNHVPGRFRYRVEVQSTGVGAPAFVAFAEADLDGNGRAEVWQVDSRDPDPVLTRQD